MFALVLHGCDNQPALLEGQPADPYRLQLEIAPDAPLAAEPAQLAYRLSFAENGQPVRDLQITHERFIHTFIVARDFSSFAHIHHEDFAEITLSDLAAATFHFPYAFPNNGAYRIVAEFTHRDRSWIKHFDFKIGEPADAKPVAIDLSRESRVDRYLATLTSSPDHPVAGHDIEFVLHLSRSAEPVTDLALLLGAEVHVALWRIDGEYFGHTHSYTPEMAAMAVHGEHSAAMMLKLMSAEAKLNYPGPDIPVRYQFKTPGVYQLFMQCAPSGEARVFRFMVEVLPYTDGIDTTVHSIVPMG
ncbi:MAG: hypothetical protein ACREXT_10700 [Gammaproteobacteria bacterium]